MIHFSRLEQFIISSTLAASLLASPLGVSAQTTASQIQGQVTETVTVNPRSQRQANAILTRLLERNSLNSVSIEKIEIEGSNVLNASTDGRGIYFSQPLWDVLQTEDQRAFVISHELAHITQHHIPQTVIRQVGLITLGQLLTQRFLSTDTQRNRILRMAQETGLSLVNLRFSRGTEYSADIEGLRLMRGAGYNPHAAIETLEILEARNPRSTPEFLQSHPLSKSRIEALVRQPTRSAMR